MCHHHHATTINTIITNGQLPKHKKNMAVFPPKEKNSSALFSGCLQHRLSGAGLCLGCPIQVALSSSLPLFSVGSFPSVLSRCNLQKGQLSLSPRGAHLALLTWKVVSPFVKKPTICWMAAMPQLVFASSVCAPHLIALKQTRSLNFSTSSAAHLGTTSAQ